MVDHNWLYPLRLAIPSGNPIGWRSHFLKPKSSTRLESSHLTPKATTSVVLNYVFTSEEITSSFSGNSVVSMVSFMVGKLVLDHQ